MRAVRSESRTSCPAPYGVLRCCTNPVQEKLRRFLLLALALVGSISGVKASDPSDLQVDWSWGRLGDDIGTQFLDAHDFDGDGLQELVLAAGGSGFSSPTAVYVVDPGLERYRCWRHLGRDFHAGRLQDLDKDSIPEILLGNADRIRALRWQDCSLVFEASLPEATDVIAFGDVDADGRVDVAWAIDDDLYVAPLHDLSDVSERIGGGGFRLRLMPVDDVPGDDILSYGNAFDSQVQVINGRDLSLLDARPAPAELVAAELDGDPVAELVYYRLDGDLEVYELGGQTPLQVDTDCCNSTRLSAQDLDGDGIDEILVAGDRVEVRDPQLAILHSFPYGFTGISPLLATDLDANGEVELIWGMGDRSTAPDYLMIGNLATGMVDFRSIEYSGPLLAHAVDTGAAAASHAIFATATDGEANPGVRVLIDGASGSAAETDLFSHGELFSRRPSSIATDIEGDGTTEVCIASPRSSLSSYVRCLDPVTLDDVWSTVVSEQVWIAAVGQFGGDSGYELLIASEDQLRAIDLDSGFLVWVSERFTGTGLYRRVHSAQVFGDRILVTYDDKVFFVDRQSGDILDVDDVSDLRELQVAGDAVFAIRGTSPATDIVRYDPVSRQVIETVYATSNGGQRLAVSPNGRYLAWADQFNGEFGQTYVLDRQNASQPTVLDVGMAQTLTLGNDGRILLTAHAGVQALSRSGLFSDGFESP